MSKTLIAYFSHTGENYFGGTIKNITKGNTAVVAETIARILNGEFGEDKLGKQPQVATNTHVVAEFTQKATGGDLFEIKTVKTYPVNYKECCDEAQKEGHANARPELAAAVPDISGYDTIVLGYPCWWGTMPQAVFTFLESADFRGKKILPFCTHEGSGMGRSESDIKKLCPKADVVRGLAINGSSCNSAEASVKNWLSSNGL